MANLVDLNKEIENLLGVVRKQKTNQNWTMIENALNSLSAQVQLLVAPPSGNSNPEVTAARVGLDGTTYASLKANLDNIQKLINTLANNVYTKTETTALIKTVKDDIKTINDDLTKISTDVATQLAKNKKDTEKAIADGLTSKQNKLNDSGWINMVLVGGASAGTAKVPQYRKIPLSEKGSRIEFRGCVQVSITVKPLDPIWKIPTGCETDINVTLIRAMQQTDKATAISLFHLTPNGLVPIYNSESYPIWLDGSFYYSGAI